MASTTKIMTAIVVLENVSNMEDLVTVSSKAAGVGGSRLRSTYRRQNNNSRFIIWVDVKIRK